MNKKRILIIFLFIGVGFGQNYTDGTTSISFKNAVKLYNGGDYLEAKYTLEKLSFEEKEYFKEEIPLLQMRIEYRLDNYSKSQNIGKSFLINYPDSDYLVDVIITFGDIFIVESKYNAAFRTYIKSLKSNAHKPYHNKILKRIFLTLQFGISTETIDEMLSLETDNYIIQLLQLAKTHTLIQSGKIHLAKDIIKNIEKRYLTGEEKEYYRQLQENFENDITSEIIPVVLPLSGKNANTGLEFLKGLQYAQSEFSSKKLKLSFIVYDNESDAVKTVEIFDKITNNDNTIAVLGPIGSNDAIAASAFIMQNKIPTILPNASLDGFSKLSDDIFLMNSDQLTRGKLAAKFIAEKLKAKTIAVLAPANNYGNDIVATFVKELSHYKLSPTITQWYSGIPMNLEHQFAAFRNTAWELADSMSYTGNAIDSLLAIYKIENDMTAEDSNDVILSSIDAIYMPIGKGHLDYVGAQFPAYNLETNVVGNENWADLNILQKENIGPHLSGLTVISNYNYCQLEQLNNNYEEKHSEYFYEAIDAYNLLIEAISKSDNYNISIKDALSSIRDFKGIFGTYDFSGSGNINTNLNIVRFDGYSFEKWVE